MKTIRFDLIWFEWPKRSVWTGNGEGRSVTLGSMGGRGQSRPWRLNKLMLQSDGFATTSFGRRVVRCTQYTEYSVQKKKPKADTAVWNCRCRTSTRRRRTSTENRFRFRCRRPRWPSTASAMVGCRRRLTRLRAPRRSFRLRGTDCPNRSCSGTSTRLSTTRTPSCARRSIVAFRRRPTPGLSRRESLSRLTMTIESPVDSCYLTRWMDYRRSLWDMSPFCRPPLTAVIPVNLLFILFKSVANQEILEGGTEDNVSAPSSFYVPFIREKEAYWKKYSEPIGGAAAPQPILRPSLFKICRIEKAPWRRSFFFGKACSMVALAWL